MKLILRSLASLIIVFCLSIVFTNHASAATFQLTGNISDSSGNNITSATIDVIDPSSNTIVESTTSNSLGDYDIYEVAGGKDKAVVEEVPVTANASGNVVVQFSTVVNNAMVNGLEVVAAE